jgi:hypothetical protein
MVTTTRRSRSANIAPSIVIQTETFLNALPIKPKEQLSLREAVGQLQEQIQEALAKGYSYQDVADMLAKQGIMISASTLKNYVPSGKRKSSKAIAPKTTRRRASAAKAEAPEAAVVSEEKPARGRRSAAKAPAAEPVAKRGRKSAAPSAPKATRGRRAKEV